MPETCAHCNRVVDRNVKGKPDQCSRGYEDKMPYGDPRDYIYGDGNPYIYRCCNCARIKGWTQYDKKGCSHCKKRAATGAAAYAEASAARNHLFVSARFDDDWKARFAEDVAAELRNAGVNVYIVNATAGQDSKNICRWYKGCYEMSAMLAVCFDDFGEQTESSYSCFEEIKYAREKHIPIIPLRLSQNWPPEPPDKAGKEQNKIVFNPSLVFVDGIGKSAAECANLLLKKAYLPMVSLFGHTTSTTTLQTAAAATPKDKTGSPCPWCLQNKGREIFGHTEANCKNKQIAAKKAARS